MFNQAELSKEGGLFRALQQLGESADGNVAKLSAVIPNIRALVGAMAIGGAEEKIPKILDEITGSAGKTERGLEKMMDTWSFSADQMKSTWEELKITVGEFIAKNEPLQAVMDVINKTFQDLVYGIREGEGQFANFGNLIGDVVRGSLSVLLETVAYLLDAFAGNNGLAWAVKTVNVTFTVVGSSIMTLINTLEMLWISLKLVYEMFTLSGSEVNKLKAEFVELGKEMADRVVDTVNEVSEEWKAGSESAEKLAGHVRDLAEKVGEAGVTVTDVIPPTRTYRGELERVGEVAKETSEAVGELNGAIAGSLTGEETGVPIAQIKKAIYEYADALRNIPSAYSTWSPVIAKVMKQIKDLPIEQQRVELEKLRVALGGVWDMAGAGKSAEEMAKIGGHISESVKDGMDKGTKDGGLLAEQNFKNTAKSMGNSMATAFGTMFQSNALDPEYNLGEAWRDFGDTASMNLTKALSDPFIGAGSPMETFFTGAMEMAGEFSAGMMEDISAYFTEKFAMQEADQATQIASNATTSATITSQNVASASASATAWTPGAVMASIATLGSAIAMGMLVQVIVRKAMSWFADGGFVNEPTMGMVGEEGREVIIPLTKPQRARSLLGEVYESYPGLFGIATHRGESEAVSSVGKTNNINITVNVDAGNSPHATGWTIAKAIDEILGKKMQGAYK
tara:strand:- start:5882 stop:7924 length:2043 start_codon:yes stop_codon:yes gene_type:complete